MMKILFAFLLTSLYLVVCSQECQQVTVCGDGVMNNRRDGRGEKGSMGSSGKSGPPGGKGSKGEVGEGLKGSKGESCALGSFESEIRKKFEDMELLLTPASCVSSSAYGRQILRSGKEAFCDGGWTVFQRRFDGSVDFNQNWNVYKEGFGDLSGEFWLGLDKIYNLTRRRGCKLRVDMWDLEEDYAFAEYSSFSLEDESDRYRLHVGGYSGTAGDSFAPSDSTDHNNNMQFTTKDMDNDMWSNNCAFEQGVHQGGWWFNRCGRSRLNTRWGPSQGSWTSVIWYQWKKRTDHVLRATTMKLRCV